MNDFSAADDGIHTYRGNWKYFLATAGLAALCGLAGWAATVPAARQHSMPLGLVALALWAAALLFTVAFLMGLALDIRNRQTLRRLRKSNRYGDMLYNKSSINKPTQKEQ